MLNRFSVLTGDHNPLHCDKDFAQSCGYTDRVAYGMLTGAFLSTLAGMYLPGKYSLIQSVEMKFKQPVFIGDTLTVCGCVEEIYENLQIMRVRVLIKNQKGVSVLMGKMQIGWTSEQFDE